MLRCLVCSTSPEIAAAIALPLFAACASQGEAFGFRITGLERRGSIALPSLKLRKLRA